MIPMLGMITAVYDIARLVQVPIEATEANDAAAVITATRVQPRGQ